MAQLILHHYPTSPFAEKIRTVLGFKALSWAGVTIPRIMPKPDVVALTGGYRKTPILQIGADIYCDSALIADVLETLAHNPSLYPKNTAAASRTLAQWADSTLFWTVIPYTLQPAGLAHIFQGSPPEEIKAFGDDRAVFRANLHRMRPADAICGTRIYFERLTDMLGDDPFIFGAVPSIGDFAVYHCLWFIARGGPVAKIFDEFPVLKRFFERMRAIGHGKSLQLSSTDAINIARAATPLPSAGVNGDSHGFALGERVLVNATDTGLEPTEGVLYGVSRDRFSISREDPRAGKVVVHFPKLGFEMRRPR
jgi:glutathione S-transferase